MEGKINVVASEKQVPRISMYTNTEIPCLIQLARLAVRLCLSQI